MSGQGGFSKACCTLPPAEAEYTHKGSFETVGGFKSYVVGPKDAKVAILYIYDIFGFSPQIQQGADLLASAGHRVVMPDIIGSNAVERSWFDGSEAGNAAKAKWFSQYPGKTDSHVEDAHTILKALKEDGHQTLVGVGACWGYKVLAMSEAGKGNLDVIVATHPSMTDPADVDYITCPALLLCSKSESKEACEGLYANLERKNPGKNEITWYKDSEHGWMGARADLKDEAQRKSFHRGFTQIADFIQKHTE